MNFPAPCRAQRLLFISVRTLRSSENLNSTLFLTRTGTTALRTSCAQDVDDDTCIFHPCVGGCFLVSSGAMQPNQTPLTLANIRSLDRKSTRLNSSHLVISYA